MTVVSVFFFCMYILSLCIQTEEHLKNILEGKIYLNTTLNIKIHGVSLLCE